MSAEVKVKQLWEEVRNLSLGNTGAVERLPSPPSPLQFLRNYISQNKPCLISAATLHWPATTLWTSNDTHLLTALSSSSVSVHLTPTGAADSLTPHPSSPSPTRRCFATAHVESMPFPHALSAVYASNRDKEFVGYAQQQNDCFNSEYSGIRNDCESHIPWASEALGCLPDAVNLWIGNHHSETSFHKDHYENLYAVVSGEKHFLLLPPTDVHRMYVRNYPVAHYKYVKEISKFRLEAEEPEVNVPWCSVNPYPSPENIEKERSQFPLFFNGPKPFEVTVKAGEILYLPSMWFHHVRQSPDRLGRTIAVNYWYDMQFDIKYAYFNFVKSIPLTLRDQANGSMELSDPELEGDLSNNSNCEDQQQNSL